jgi:hypothetical protein
MGPGGARTIPKGAADLMIRYILASTILSCALAAGAAALAQDRPAPADEKDYCVICHEQQTQDRLKKPVAEWRASVHGTAGKRCESCHGGNPALNDRLLAHALKSNFRGKPDRKKDTEYCGRDGCHVKAAEQFKRGPHYLSVMKSGEPGCVTCHGSHKVRRSSIDVISEKSCTACHPADYSRDIVKLIGEIDRGISRIDGNLVLLADKRAEVKALQDRLNNTRHLFHQMVHVFSREDMETTKRIVELEIASLDTETIAKVSSIQRIDMLYLVMLGFGLFIIGGVSIYSAVMYGRRKKR